jgi:hypoxanthine-guanine phosphoribosyltransferase
MSLLISDKRTGTSSAPRSQVEDIVDTGLTITTVSRYLLDECGAASVATATLLDKHERRKLTYRPEYVGFVVSFPIA